MYGKDKISLEDSIGITTVALFEAKVSNERIIQLLQKYYNLTYEEANDYYILEKNVNVPCRQLELYLKAEGLGENDIYDYFEKNNVGHILSENQELTKLSPEKLKKEIEIIVNPPREKRGKIVAHAKIRKNK